MSLIGAAFGRPLFCLPLAPCRKALPTALSLARIFPVEDQPAVALFHKSASLFSNRLPKVLGPGAHSVIDYSVAALFFTAGALFWSRHKNASISALLCGTGVLLNGLFTDYPGGVVRAISFETHGKLMSGSPESPLPSPVSWALPTTLRRASLRPPPLPRPSPPASLTIAPEPGRAGNLSPTSGLRRAATNCAGSPPDWRVQPRCDSIYIDSHGK